MALKIVTHVERPDLNDRWNDAARSVWPEFALHDAVVVLRPPLGRVRLHRADEPGVVPERDGR